MFPVLSINGTPAPCDDETESAALDFNPDSGPTHRCRACGDELTRTMTGWVTDDGDGACLLFEPDDDTGHEQTGPHDPAPIPFAWCNSAAITTEESDDAVTVALSVGDPRGAFCFTVTRIPDDAESDLAGCLLLHTPHPGEPAPHAALTELHPGTYVVGTVPAALAPRITRTGSEEHHHDHYQRPHRPGVRANLHHQPRRTR
ncbi:hypothetical protein [Murinocardiopsis flavida]|uniref:hypothetical protein n=1 Tax=Murinocardiopsis flavida TaxID=645275 RepID=UPI000D0D607D|nr:hypothetical protein [Murinocardiopsis flavida]